MGWAVESRTILVDLGEPREVWIVLAESSDGQGNSLFVGGACYWWEGTEIRMADLSQNRATNVLAQVVYDRVLG